jgi:hypothetical protein
LVSLDAESGVIMSPPADEPAPRTEPLAMIAFFLALFLMVLPTEADALTFLVRYGHFTKAATLAAFYFLLVATLFGLSWRRFLHAPGKWRGRGYLIATAAILMLNILGVAFVFRDESFRFYHGTYP